MIDIEKIRSDTPACNDVLHFNNAGASLMPTPVWEAMQGVLQNEYALGGYEAERRAGPNLSAFYDEFAGLLNVQPSEIAYVENATRAWDAAFYSLDLQPGDRIITHSSEYVSNYLAFLQQARRRGLEIDVAPSDGYGQIDVDGLERLITSKTRLIAITHVPTQGGLVNPAAEVGKVAQRHGVLYMLDACQSVGQIAIDVQQIGCDILSGTGRKFLRGPRGTGFLYMRQGLMDQIDPPFVDLHSARWTAANSYELMEGARRFENWESFVAGRVGLMAAVRYARQIGLDAIEARVEALGARLRDALSGVDGVTVQDLGQKKCGIVTFTKDGLDPVDIAATLRAQNINVSVTEFAFARIDLESRGLTSLVRSSIHYFNTDGEIERFVQAVGKL